MRSLAPSPLWGEGRGEVLFRVLRSTLRIVRCLLRSVMPSARNTCTIVSSVSLFPRERMRDITSLRFALVNTSGIGFFQPQMGTDAHGFGWSATFRAFQLPMARAAMREGPWALTRRERRAPFTPRPSPSFRRAPSSSWTPHETSSASWPPASLRTPALLHPAQAHRASSFTKRNLEAYGFEMSDKSSARLQVLREIKTPLALLALVVLVIETILVILANKAKGTDLTLLIIAMPLLLVALLAGVFTLLGRKPDALSSQPYDAVVEMKHDAFLAAPMASHTSDAEYKRDREDMNEIVDAMEKECGFTSVFYAGKHIPTSKQFDAADISVKNDYEALRSSRRFVLVYPFKLASSVLVEAGMAIALKKPTIIFARDRNELPFLLKEAEQAFPGLVKIYQYQTPGEIQDKFRKHRDQLFGN